jgi:type IV secretory pathway protease TraF
VDEAGLTIGGEAYGWVYIEAGGSRLPHITGCLTVGEGEVFVASKTSRSLDSRYFGPVKIADLVASATPVLVWR